MQEITVAATTRAMTEHTTVVAMMEEAGLEMLEEAHFDT